MSVTSAQPRTPSTEPQSRALRIAFRGLTAIEKVGNRLPNPFWLFWILAGIVAVLSAVPSARSAGTASWPSREPSTTTRPSRRWPPSAP